MNTERLSIFFHYILLLREFYVQLSSFRNANAFDKELNLGSAEVRRYSLSVNALTLDKLLTRLTEQVELPENEEEHLRAVSVVGKNVGIAGEPVWCLNRDVSIGKDGLPARASEFGLEWISHLTEHTTGGEIADKALSAKVDSELTTVYFNAMAHFLAGTLKGKLTYDARLRCVASELFGDNESLAFETDLDTTADELPSVVISQDKDDCESDIELPGRDNFLSQFYLSSMGVIMANYQEVSLAFFGFG